MRQYSVDDVTLTAAPASADAVSCGTHVASERAAGGEAAGGSAARAPAASSWGREQKGFESRVQMARSAFARRVMRPQALTHHATRSVYRQAARRAPGAGCRPRRWRGAGRAPASAGAWRGSGRPSTQKTSAACPSACGVAWWNDGWASTSLWQAVHTHACQPTSNLGPTTRAAASARPGPAAATPVSCTWRCRPPRTAAAGCCRTRGS